MKTCPDTFRTECILKVIFSIYPKNRMVCTLRTKMNEQDTPATWKRYKQSQSTRDTTDRDCPMTSRSIRFEPVPHGEMVQNMDDHWCTKYMHVA